MIGQLRIRSDLQSSTNLFVLISDENSPLIQIENPIIHVKQFEPFIIPCKPANPNVEVELVKSDTEEVSHYINANRLTIS